MLALFLGGAVALALPPFPLGFALPFLLAPVFLKPRGFRFGFLFGLGFWSLHLAWLPASFSARFGILGFLPGLLLTVLMAVFFGGLFAAFGRRPLALVGAWTLFEYLLAQLPWPFPWGYLGYASVEGGVRAWAGVVGVYGLGLLVRMAALAVARGAVVVGVAWALLWLLWPLPRFQPEARALLVQAAVDPLIKAEGVPAAERYLELTRQGLRKDPEVRLVVWPETAVTRLPPGIVGVLSGRPLVYGAWGPGPRNEVRLFVGGRDVAVYAKRKLVPFGEYFPGRGWLGPLYDAVFRGLGLPRLLDLVPGDRPAPLGPYAALVCYEADFPDEVRRLARKAGLLVNVSNDGWFGAGFGRRQHLAMSRMRAVENGIWLLRAANDGISAAIDPAGRVVVRSREGRAEVVLAPYALGSGGRTLYARLGELPVLGFAYLLTLLGILGSDSKNPSPPEGRDALVGSSEAAVRRRRIVVRARPQAGRRPG